MQIKVDEEIVLKQVELSDAAEIFSAIDSQRAYLGKWLPFVVFTKRQKDTEAFLKTVVDAPKEYIEFVFTIHYKEQFAGIIGFKDSDKLNKKTEIGYWLSEAFQGNGIVTKAVASLCDFAFDKLEMNRVQIKCAVENHSSIRIPKRLGFIFEGIERDGELLTGGWYTDLEIYSKLKSD